MVIENKFQKVSGLPGDDENRLAVTGLYTVDVVAMRAWLTKDPKNEAEHYDVERGTLHQRDTRSDPAIKFATNIAAESLKEGNDGQFRWLSTKWQDKYETKENKGFPSLNQIFDGIKKEQKKLLILNSGLEEDSDALKEALANIVEVWDEYLFGQIPENERDSPLTKEILEDPTHPVVILLTYLYTLGKQTSFQF